MFKIIIRNSNLVFGWSLIVNGFVGLFFLIKAILGLPDMSVTLVALILLLPLIGILSGSFVLRGHLWALIAGILFYAVQIVRYRSSSFNFDFSSGFNLIITLSSGGKTIIFNILAACFLALGIAALRKHIKTRSKSPV